MKCQVNRFAPVVKLFFVHNVAVCLSKTKSPTAPLAEAIRPFAGPAEGNPFGASKDWGSLMIRPYFSKALCQLFLLSRAP